MNDARRSLFTPSFNRGLEQQDANLRRALRTAGPRAAERITLEIEVVSAELAAAATCLD